MPKTAFIYLTNIAATPEKVWNALIDGESTKKYWGMENVSDWKPGSKWEHKQAGEPTTVMLVGRVVEFTPHRRMIWTWADSSDAARPEKHSRVTFDLEPVEDMVRLTVTHDELETDSDMEKGIRAGWPRVLSSLKSLLETGKPLNT
jgi:uncharacterized protein YndB with AHSA1/START domain